MYDDFSSDYDRFVSWPGRLALEMPFLQRQLEEAGAKEVLDVACGTGMHAIALAQAGYEVSGTDISTRMIDRARVNAQMARVNVRFKQAGFGEQESTFGKARFHAVLCLGNSLPHLLTADQLDAALADLFACLKPGGLLILQNRNFDVVMQERMRWMEPQSTRDGQAEWLFLRFYDFAPDGLLSFNIITLYREGESEWRQATGSTTLRPLLAAELETTLGRAGFQSITFYGDMKGAPFDMTGSGNLVACARLGQEATSLQA